MNVIEIEQPLTPIQQVVLDFKWHYFSHPHAHETFTQLGIEIGAISAPPVIILTGPTGIGKSTLTRLACRRMKASLAAHINARPDFIPAIILSAATPNGNAIPWKDLFIRLLSGQHEPLIEKKRFFPKQLPLLPSQYSAYTGLDGFATDPLRRAAEEYLKRRGVRLLVIEEAQHLLLSQSAARRECHFESLKHLASETGTTILLVGTYRLLDILEQSAQLARRSMVLNFPRYDVRIRDDREHFLNILEHLSVKLSEHVPTDLTKNAEYFYHKSAGCLGILKDWMARCLETALNENLPRIDFDLATRFALPNKDLVTIIEEAWWGEQKLVDVDDSVVIDLLKNGPASTLANKARAALRSPGTRRPKRDLVGEVIA